MHIEVIKKRLSIIKDLQDEARKVKANLDESLNNNQYVQEAQNKKDQFQQDMAEISEKIASFKESSTIKAMSDSLKELKQDIKENKEILSQDLADYYKETGSLEITDEDGNVARIKFNAKLKTD